MKIAIYGGTFDPIHEGHIAIIEDLSNKFDRVVVVPAYYSGYYKNANQMFGYEERLKEVKLKLSDFRNVIVSDIERGKDNSWRYLHTLKALIGAYDLKEKDQIYTIIGSDSLYNFHKWFCYQEILKLSKLLVYNRSTNPIEDFKGDISFEAVIDFKKDISSSQIRKNLSNKE